MFDRIYVHNWISLDKEIRKHLVSVFGLVPTGIAEIRDQTVISDGYSNADLDRITAAKMAEYVGSNESFPRLWELTLAKVKYELHPPIDLETLNQPEIVNIIPPTPVQIPERTLNSPNTIEVKSDRFCETCDSKGVRHKKECAKYVPWSGTQK